MSDNAHWFEGSGFKAGDKIVTNKGLDGRVLDWPPNGKNLWCEIELRNRDVSRTPLTRKVNQLCRPEDIRLA